MMRRDSRVLAGLFCAALAGLPLAQAKAAPAPAPAQPDAARANQEDIEYAHMYQSILQQVDALIREYHVDTSTRKKLLEGAIRGMLEATQDPYSRFMDREEHREFNHSEGGDLVGIGVEITVHSGYPMIMAPVPGGPAEKAGLKIGDKIITIDGKSTRYVGLSKLSQMIAGEPGSILELGIYRGNIQFPVRVERGVFQLEYVKKAYLAQGKAGYVRLQAFFGEDAGSVRKFRESLQEFANQKVRGVVLDLRNNSGGHVEMARVLAGYFLEKDALVYRVKSRTDEKLFLTDGESRILGPDVKLVILINRGSASASEILAGCLQDHGRAILVGEQSFGKASVQQIFRPLPDDTAVLITTQRYYTPKSRSLHGVGLTPDIVVPEITSTPQENVYLGTVEEKKLLEKFLKDHPEYNEGLIKTLADELRAAQLPIREEVIRLILRREYGVREPELDLKSDPQLARALSEILK
jgi:carboxyl-terminal processing protease